METPHDLVCVGNALVDILAEADAASVESAGFDPGSVNHVDHERASALVRALGQHAVPPKRSSGGCALNTARLASFLGIRAAFCGAVGRDPEAAFVASELTGAGVDARLMPKDVPTGVFVELRETSNLRTIVAARGASALLESRDLPDDLFRPGALLYLDGYLLGRGDLVERSIERGRSAGMTVALDLGSAALAARHADLLARLFRECRPLVFMNEAEALAFSGGHRDLERLSACGGEFVVKRAERGAAYVGPTGLVDNPVRSEAPFDETGAGDAFAAGFLAARLGGMTVERCLRHANRVACEVIRVPLCDVDRERLRAAFSSV